MSDNRTEFFDEVLLIDGVVQMSQQVDSMNDMEINDQYDFYNNLQLEEDGRIKIVIR